MPFFSFFSISAVTSKPVGKFSFILFIFLVSFLLNLKYPELKTTYKEYLHTLVVFISSFVNILFRELQKIIPLLAYMSICVCFHRDYLRTNQ